MFWDDVCLGHVIRAAIEGRGGAPYEAVLALCEGKGQVGTISPIPPRKDALFAGHGPHWGPWTQSPPLSLSDDPSLPGSPPPSISPSIPPDHHPGTRAKSLEGARRIQVRDTVFIHRTDQRAVRHREQVGRRMHRAPDTVLAFLAHAVVPREMFGNLNAGKTRHSR